MTFKDINAISKTKIPKKIKSLLSLLNISIMFIACAESTGTQVVSNSVTDCRSARNSLERCIANNSQTSELGYAYEVNCARQLKLVQQFCKFSLDMDIDLGQVLPDQGIDESLDQDMPSEDQIVPQEDQGLPVEDQMPPVEDQMPPVEDQGVPEEDQNTPIEDQGVPEEDQNTPMEDQGLIQDMGNELVYPDNIPVEHRDSVDTLLDEIEAHNNCNEDIDNYSVRTIEKIANELRTLPVSYVANCTNLGFERVAFMSVANADLTESFQTTEAQITQNGCLDVNGGFYVVPFDMIGVDNYFRSRNFISFSDQFRDFVFEMHYRNNSVRVRYSNVNEDFLSGSVSECN